MPRDEPSGVWSEPKAPIRTYVTTKTSNSRTDRFVHRPGFIDLEGNTEIPCTLLQSADRQIHSHHDALLLNAIGDSHYESNISI